MKLIDLNRHGGIGANSIFARIGSFNILVDCGLHPKKMGLDALPEFKLIEEFKLDLIILTHAHLDHLGTLPIISRKNPKTPIITSYPNCLLAPRMLRNSVNVMKRQKEEHGITYYPLFTHREIVTLSKRLEPQRFNKPRIFRKGNDTLEITLHSAGHIVGAAAVSVVNKNRRILFSGDVLFHEQRTLPGASLPIDNIDTLVLETTHGSKPCDPEINRTTEIKRLIKKIAEILDRGGSCIVPVFALGRMQEIFKVVHEARTSGLLPLSDVFATGLGIDLCKHFDKIRKQTQLVNFDINLLDQLGISSPDPNIVPGRDIKNKGLYIVSSGMLINHTPSYRVAASLLPHKKNGICFVGYCDPDTPGGSLLEKQNEETFFFDAINYLSPIRASIDQFDISGHANRDELLNYAVQTNARTIVLNHGDPDARNWFKDSLSKQMPNTKVLDPEPLVEYVV